MQQTFTHNHLLVVEMPFSRETVLFDLTIDSYIFEPNLISFSLNSHNDDANCCKRDGREFSLFHNLSDRLTKANSRQEEIFSIPKSGSQS